MLADLLGSRALLYRPRSYHDLLPRGLHILQLPFLIQLPLLFRLQLRLFPLSELLLLSFHFLVQLLLLSNRLWVEFSELVNQFVEQVFFKVFELVQDCNRRHVWVDIEENAINLVDFSFDFFHDSLLHHLLLVLLVLFIQHLEFHFCLSVGLSLVDYVVSQVFENLDLLLL